MRQGGKGRQGSKGKEGGEGRSVAERVSTAVCLLLLSTVVATVAYFGAAQDPLPPLFSVKVGEARRDGSLLHVPFQVKNEGDMTAKQVTVQGRVTTELGEQRAETTFDYLAGKSTEKGVFVFTELTSPPEIRVVAYQLP
jgi:uncharacterized protein (TIGR02588 family)